MAVVERRIPFEQRPLSSLSEQRLDLIRGRALETVEVIDRQTGYLRLGWMNKEGYIDEEALRMSAEIIHEVMARTRPDIILGVGESGLPLARAVHHVFTEEGLETGRYKDYREVRKSSALTPEERNAMDFSVAPNTLLVSSFTHKQVLQKILVPPVNKGQRVLIIDDVIAHGATLDAIVRKIQSEGGVVAGIAANMSKDFQGGIAKASTIAEAPAFAVVRFAQTNPELALVPRESAQTPFIPKIVLDVLPSQVTLTKYAYDR